MDKIKAPFTQDQVRSLNFYQASGLHPFTCCSHKGCNRLNQPYEGTLFATTDGWRCPCGEYSQDWAHAFMAENMNVDAFHKYVEDIKAGKYKMGDSGSVGEELLADVPEEKLKYEAIKQCVAEKIFFLESALEAYGMSMEKYLECKTKYDPETL